MENILTAAALCAVGAEKVVSNEIRKLGLQVIEGGFGRVRFKADPAGLYRSLMGLRTADRVLLETARFPADNFDALFEGVKAVPWEQYIPSGMGLAVAKVRTNRSKLRAETSVQGVAHKAAAERLCEKLNINRLPEYGDTAELRVYIEKDQVSLLLDLSGDPLFKRGYRFDGGIAPLRETTAAAIILLAGWRRKFPLYDPFCGSGTIAIEAAMYAWDMAPGLGRRFALDSLLLGDKKIAAAIREELLGKVDFSRTIRIWGSDADNGAIAHAKANVARAFDIARGKIPEPPQRTRQQERSAQKVPGTLPRLPSLPGFRTLPMEAALAPEIAVSEETAAPAETASQAAGFIITNPPYGKRLGNGEETEAIYQGMGILARNFSGWKLALITDHPGFESFFGRKADSCREITNGAIRSYFYQYEELKNR